MRRRVAIGTMLLLAAFGHPAAAGDRKPCETCTVDLTTGSALGIFDPSLEADGRRVWASYSAVDTPITPSCATNGHVSTIEHVDTRLAYSDSRGATWLTRGSSTRPTTFVCQSPTASAPG